LLMLSFRSAALALMNSAILLFWFSGSKSETGHPGRVAFSTDNQRSVLSELFFKKSTSCVNK
jgi:hypothetical protein